VGALGEVAIRRGRVGRRLILTGAQLDNRGGIALALSGTEIASDLFCRDATIVGEARLAGSQVRGHLDLERTRLLNPSGTALDALAMQAGELSLRPAEPIQGIVDLRHARVGVIRDDPSCWPDGLATHCEYGPLAADTPIRGSPAASGRPVPAPAATAAPARRARQQRIQVRPPHPVPSTPRSCLPRCASVSVNFGPMDGACGVTYAPLQPA
jgi:adhesin HecA-like repeat protein